MFIEVFILCWAVAATVAWFRAELQRNILDEAFDELMYDYTDVGRTLERWVDEGLVEQDFSDSGARIASDLIKAFNAEDREQLDAAIIKAEKFLNDRVPERLK